MIYSIVNSEIFKDFIEFVGPDSFNFTVQFLIPFLLSKIIMGEKSLKDQHQNHKIFIALFIKSFLMIKQLCDAHCKSFLEHYVLGSEKDINTQIFYAFCSMLVPLFGKDIFIFLVLLADGCRTTCIALSDNFITFLIFLMLYLVWDWA